MLYTVEWIKEKYDFCNLNYFGGKLPIIKPSEITITNTQHNWGRGGCQYFIKDKYGNYQAMGVILKLSNFYDSPENVKMEILVHEMVHIYEYFCEPQYYIDCKRLNKWTKEHPQNGHGKVFYEQATRLTKYGFHVERYVTKENQDASTVSDVAKEKHAGKLKKGVHALKFIFTRPEISTKGIPFNYGYVVPSSNAYGKWLYYCKNHPETFSSVKDCLTHDPEILTYKISRNTNSWYLKKDYEDIFRGITFESETEIMGVNNIDDMTNYPTKEDINTYWDFVFSALKNKIVNINIRYDSRSERDYIPVTKFKITLPNKKTLNVILRDEAKFGDGGGTRYECGTLIYEDPNSYLNNLALECYGIQYVVKGSSDYDFYSENITGYIQDMLTQCFGETYTADFNANYNDNTESKPQQQNPEPPKQQEPIIPHFFFRTKQGNEFDMKNATRSEIKAKLHEKFPKWSDEVLERTLNNQSYYIKENKMKKFVINENDIREMTEMTINRINQEKQQDLERKKWAMSMPDVLPGHVDID